MRLDELDGLLEQADEVRALLDAPELLLAQPSLVLDMVGDMEQDVLQQRWDAAGDLLAAESVMLAMQRDVAELLSRVPSCWRCWPALEDSAGSPQPASPSVGCPIA
ncbi:hypothetical protein HYH03_012601 [Edaphochlamys debaryana]|uniref:Uncharacterized protein n=1 Tax=Edaphochlamys debaryana TaxID=47281 RepID=A0A836BTQ7_9CHLO|nr:hypothetical protein HYH03_012601 [Edaphochlamys debaryana]|eukprot:KAG2488801.1 hypothetical protein HYH03_012601 [Edaphochlamys debaryana]